ncbi:hypothetical protein G9U51_05795 [Calidifontibacter sp. DB0510]|uniref:Uncharacterized protein n=1 Tax=Metallococcus carri TaxID=1656884 RepID=A0A967AYD4_9MICO|nr:hypothetical protein [Metallococcus carri]NHN55296.1 hypothetical protein [Metallococcus carri]NOP36373.1 hypothetical protein [Calidifontibacter sp. DB2511S]
MEPKRKGRAMTIIGAIMLVLAPIIFFGGTFIGVAGLANEFKNYQPLDPGASVQADGNVRQDIYAAGSSSTSTTEASDCTVTGPQGEVSVSGPNSSTSYSSGDTSATKIGSFTPPETGSYTVDCGTQVRVLPQAVSDKVTQNILASIGFAFAGALVLGVLGLILLIIGIIRWTGSNKARSQWRMQQQAAQWGGYGGPGGYGGQPPYNTR